MGDHVSSSTGSHGERFGLIACSYGRPGHHGVVMLGCKLNMTWVLNGCHAYPSDYDLPLGHPGNLMINTVTLESNRKMWSQHLSNMYTELYRSRKLMRSSESSETSGGPRQSSLMELQLRLELGHLDYWWTLMKELLDGWALQQFQTTPKKCWKISCPPWRPWSWKTKLSMVKYMITDDSYIMLVDVCWDMG